LLPIGEAGKFDYVPSPFVTSLQQPSVYLLDELDAADANVLLMLNSIMSNGFLTVPHKLNSPTIRRHEDAIIVAGANTGGGGADDVYSARGALDGATIDRFYTLAVDYDAAYEKSLFCLPGQKKRTRSAEWSPAGAPVTEQTIADLQQWFEGLRKGTSKARLGRIVSSRMAQRLVASVVAGVPVEEAKADLLLTWSVDERARAQAGV
jgi:MoxR-like ATPase